MYLFLDVALTDIMYNSTKLQWCVCGGGGGKKQPVLSSQQQFWSTQMGLVMVRLTTFLSASILSSLPRRPPRPSPCWGVWAQCRCCPDKGTSGWPTPSCSDTTSECVHGPPCGSPRRNDELAGCCHTPTANESFTFLYRYSSSRGKWVYASITCQRCTLSPQTYHYRVIRFMFERRGKSCGTQHSSIFVFVEGEEKVFSFLCSLTVGLQLKKVFAVSINGRTHIDTHKTHTLRSLYSQRQKTFRVLFSVWLAAYNTMEHHGGAIIVATFDVKKRQC